LGFDAWMNFGFVSTRFAGTDGVSLESLKWAEVLARDGHRCFWVSGLSDRPGDVSMVVPEAHFAHPEIEAISAAAWGRDSLTEETAEAIGRYRVLLREALAGFVARFSIDVLVPQNAVTIPMNLPLGLAIADHLRVSGLPAIAHHHDFFWERERFSGAAAMPFLEEAFPPRLPSIAHAVIHSEAAEELHRRVGVESVLVPNVMEFEQAPPVSRWTREELLHEIGFAAGDRIILQPTRVVPRKGIEHAVELLHRLGDPRNRLLVSHEAGDEGFDYRDELLAMAERKGVSIRFLEPGGASHPSLDDLYHHADFVTFPSLYEGFGNALLEAVWFRKPVLVNRYPVYRRDLEPCGFRFVTMDGAVDEGIVTRVRERLDDPERFLAEVGENAAIAREHFGYTVLQERLRALLGRLDLR
jgi:glycosyltransferase involved in cell wall biosynthesis